MQEVDEEEEVYDTPRKRQRLSSPTYDEHFELPSQEEVEAFETFNERLSQVEVSPTRHPSSNSPRGKGKRTREPSPSPTDGSPRRALGQSIDRSTGLI